jgi:hypothetical protein
MAEKPKWSDGRWELIRKDFLERIEELDKRLGFEPITPDWVFQMKKAYRYVEERRCD